jgi:hypothetical protein
MVNHLAVVVAALFNWLLGALWYSPFLFAPQWMKALNINPKSLEQRKKALSMSTIMAVSFASLWVLSYVLAFVLELTSARTLGAGALTGFLLWLGFVATTSLSSVLYESKPVTVYWIYNAYQLIAIVLSAAVLAVWR